MGRFTDMTLKTPDERVFRTAELVEALEKSIRELRQQAEDLAAQLKAGGDADLKNGKSQIAAVEGLLRSCLKTEAHLVEQQQRSGLHICCRRRG